MEKMEPVVVGLIAGRHSLPVSEFIFAGEIQDVLDFRSLAKTIDQFLADRVGVSVVSGCGVNQDDYTDVRVWCGRRDLVVYVTGLTAVSTELVAACARNGVNLTLMHFNRDTGEYVPQSFRFGY